MPFVQYERRSAPQEMAFEHLVGHEEVLAARPALSALAEASGQRDSVEDLSYFLEKPGLMRRTPHLVLMRDTSRQRGSSTPVGALLIHEFRPFGVPSRVFASNDRSGRGVLLGAPQQRLRFALRASDLLFRKGAKMVLLTVQSESSPSMSGWGRSVPGVRWAVRNRQQPSHLDLSDTYEGTLARLGQKTRANLRYYRRRAESELRCRFLPDLNIKAEDLADFNRDSSFPLPERVLRWRLAVQSKLRSPYLMGLQDGDGRWLSVIAGRRYGDSTEILWQLNRSGLQRHSIVTAMRSFHLEHEIARGTKRFYVEGGTNHSMQHSFESAAATDIIMIRNRLQEGMRGFAKRYVPPDNILADMLNDPTNEWHSS
ncbi:GNAT family N-acetyltransferase [Terriglobus aquaticus]|uniref:Acetyltransferase (GNAT) domain-containing protein n=1 Tax=Terriglobus aquaticus TaxID=940139 RepID=A0ABW9KMW0_9BACT